MWGWAKLYNGAESRSLIGFLEWIASMQGQNYMAEGGSTSAAGSSPQLKASIGRSFQAVDVSNHPLPVKKLIAFHYCLLLYSMFAGQVLLIFHCVKETRPAYPPARTRKFQRSAPAPLLEHPFLVKRPRLVHVSFPKFEAQLLHFLPVSQPALC
ncbi:hypothetical protein CK203_009736 [Vitis vinifera]|uniref:Uncharacterized protein n=1 Tax=Vitis vinifera TaxID=29760 RepID=A0A438JV20_VITVI|nr:hypothetical protein CK203_009736 [Vitis vinifera]